VGCSSSFNLIKLIKYNDALEEELEGCEGEFEKDENLDL
jgi:hypothetical protein